MLVQVHDQVLLGLELPSQLVGMHHAQGALLALLGGLLLHGVCVRMFKMISRPLEAVIGGLERGCGIVRERYA